MLIDSLSGEKNTKIMINTTKLLSLIKLTFGNRCLRAVMRDKILSIMCTEKEIKTKIHQKAEKILIILKKKKGM